MNCKSLLFALAATVIGASTAIATDSVCASTTSTSVAVAAAPVHVQVATATSPVALHSAAQAVTLVQPFVPLVVSPARVVSLSHDIVVEQASTVIQRRVVPRVVQRQVIVSAQRRLCRPFGRRVQRVRVRSVTVN